VEVSACVGLIRGNLADHCTPIHGELSADDKGNSMGYLLITMGSFSTSRVASSSFFHPPPSFLHPTFQDDNASSGAGKIMLASGGAPSVLEATSRWTNSTASVPHLTGRKGRREVKSRCAVLSARGEMS
jgi:hypothetical protein